jgi:2-polyprenyl-6-methoxyphenol hydroxylase-like FAD-dependent oxidoreductase
VLSCSPEGELKTDGGIRKFDLVVGADGIGSTVRRCVDPDFEPKYCGYVAIRGTVEAGNLPSSAIELWRHITAGQLLGIYLRQAHVVMYAPPAQKTGNNTLNWVWYHNYDDLETLLTDTSGQHHRWSLPPDRMSAEFHDDLMRQAFEDFPEPLAEILAATRAPYLQAIFHGLPKSFVHGRAVLVGDAAHVSTPHLGAASSLAYHDVQSLARALAEGQSLQDWSATRHEAVKDTLETSYAMGQALQFAEQSWDDWATQDFDNWWQKLISGRRPYFDP